MGMDAIIKGKDLRFSQLLAEVAYELYPELKKNEGYIELSSLRIGALITEMAIKLDLFRIIEKDKIPLKRVQYIISNASKLYTLIEWYDETDILDTLIFT